jgi:TatD DNase family protein
MIDCHAHISSSAFDNDRDDVIRRARSAGIQTIIAVGENIKDSRKVLQLALEYPGFLRPCIGIHPDNFGDDRQAPVDEEIANIISLIRDNQKELVGIGEVGLDYWVAREKDTRRKQREFLAQMVGLSNELSLPLSVHCRSAGNYTLELLAQCGAKKVSMHAFDGKAGYALEAYKMHAWIFSIPPSIVRSAQKQRLVRALPLDALALETDSPALGPDPKRRNEPSNINLVVQAIAELKKETEQTVRRATKNNAQRLFGLA